MNREYRFYVYILASRTLRFYVGVANDIWRRVLEHKVGADDGFTSRYNVNRLVFYQAFQYFNNAVEREKQLKDWRREKKIALIKSVNPTWIDLAENWYTDEDFARASAVAERRRRARVRRAGNADPSLRSG